MEIERIVRMEYGSVFVLKLFNSFGSFKSWSCRAVIKWRRPNISPGYFRRKIEER